MKLENNKNLLETALKCIERGIPVFFVKGKYAPKDFGWKELQDRVPTVEELKEWFKKYEGLTGIAMVTGRLSGVIAIDTDVKDPDNSVNPDILKRLRSEGHPEAQSASGGNHFMVAYDALLGFSSNNGVLPGLDIKSQGGYILIEPSVGLYGPEYQKYNGNVYKWIKEFKSKDDLEPFPEWLLEIIRQNKKGVNDKNWKEKLVLPITSGTRNDSFASIVGGLLKRFPTNEWDDFVWPTVQDKNKLQEKPLGESELKTIYNSIAKAETQNRYLGGDIKDISVEMIEEDMRINVVMDKSTVCFKIKNIISSLSEASAITWLQKDANLTHEIPFYLKIKSDSNKEQWVRILTKAFDRKNDKEEYPWTIIVAKVVTVVEDRIKNRQQCFAADTIVAKDCTWLLEPFIQEDVINTIFGMGGGGKTFMALHFAKEIAQLYGYNILFVDYEDTAGGFKSKLDRVKSLNNFTFKSNKFFYFDSEQIPLAEQIDKIKCEIKKNDIKLVVVDSASLATGESTSDEKAAVRLASALKLLKTTVLLIAHQRKNNGDKTPIGSVQYENQSRNVWNVSGEPDSKNNHIVHVALSHTKTNNTYIRKDPIGFMVNFADNEIMITKESAKIHFKEKLTTKERIRALLKKDGELTAIKIAELLGEEPAKISKNLTLGKDRGFWKNKNCKWKLVD
jgi:hypothetical protein